ncbi:HEPN domain-containing protein [Rhodanobacter sp. Root179]|uniref:HEPN domain-containing protein n=1 Tax=Rhodanobacter sp. Root179 TaxID=1736482 RepID=UPI001F3C4053|nr:HEPN domain-containing protein [Rhodanobacter sp. Root179]
MEPTTTTDASALKQRHRQIRDNQPESLRIRIHRAVSWVARAEREQDDHDARYIFLWIAFNAAYASEFGFEQKERDQVRQFIDRLLRLDDKQRLHHALFNQFSGPIRTLIDNRYVFEPFWKALRSHDSSKAWEESFASSRKVAMKALLGNDTSTLLSIVLDRLYVLRNQLIHGGATWGSATNRAQVKDGVAILGVLLPITIELMMEDEKNEFDAVAYPVA